MKRTLFQFLNLLMACVILLSSTGFGLVEHSCQMRGKKKTMVVVFSDANAQAGCADQRQTPPSDQTVLKKTDCCQDDQRYENVDVTSSLNQLVAKFVKSLTESVLAGVTVILTWLVDCIFNKSASVAVNITDLSPSRSGRDILTLINTLLI